MRVTRYPSIMFPAVLLGALLVLPGLASAQSLQDRWRALRNPPTAESPVRNLGDAEAAEGIREAMARGVDAAVRQLGRPDGFLGNEAVRIGVPRQMRGVADGARRLGAGHYVEAFETSMNRAAERAVPAAAEVFSDAVRQMTVTDALGIVRGGETAGTEYFRSVAGQRLRERFLPIVSTATSQSGVTQRYKELSGRTGGMGALLGGGQSLDLDEYVTERALDGLFHVVAEQERAIRRDPVGTGSALLRRVFGG